MVLILHVASKNSTFEKDLAMSFLHFLRVMIRYKNLRRATCKIQQDHYSCYKFYGENNKTVHINYVYEIKHFLRLADQG